MSVISATKNSWKRKVTFYPAARKGQPPKGWARSFSTEREHAPSSPLGASTWWVSTWVWNIGCEWAPSVCRGRFCDPAREPIIENSGSGLAESQEEGARLIRKVSKCGLSLSKKGESWWEQSWQALSPWCPQAQRVPCDQSTFLGKEALVYALVTSDEKTPQIPQGIRNASSWA